MKFNFINKEDRTRKKIHKLMDELSKSVNYKGKNKHEYVSKLYTEYSKLCYELPEDRSLMFDIFGILNDSYIIESTPVLKEVDMDKFAGVVKHLEEIRNGSHDGLSEEEVEILLDWTVMNTRNNLSKENDILNDSLGGSCGFGQSSSLFPLEDLGLRTTVNNVTDFPISKYRHAFGTVFIPVKVGDRIVTKQYLIDTTYRQFFPSLLCNEGRYYSNGFAKDKCSPCAGYFMARDSEHMEFATHLLKYGHIEFTPSNAKCYADGFILGSIGLSEMDKMEEFEKYTGEDMINAVIQGKEEHDYERSEFEGWGYNVRVPGLDYSKEL